MADSRRESEWRQTSLVVAAIVNIMRDPKKGKAPEPDDFNPYAKRRKRLERAAAPKVPLSILRDVFCKG